MSTEKAKQQGAALLSSYRKQRKRPDSRDELNDSAALSDGSLLAFKFLGSHVKATANREGKESVSAALEKLRLATVQLLELELNIEESDKLGGVLSLLQDVEEYLEQDESRAHTFTGRITYDETEGPEPADRQLRSFIDPNFSRSEGDLEYYETVVGELVEKLETMSAEKNDLELISTALSERLQKLSRERESTTTAVMGSFDEERSDLLSRIKYLEDKISMEQDPILVADHDPSSGRRVVEQYMKNQLDLNAEEWENYERIVNQLQARLQSTEQELLEFKQKYEDLRLSVAEGTAEQKSNVSRLAGGSVDFEEEVISITQMREVQVVTTQLNQLQHLQEANQNLKAQVTDLLKRNRDLESRVNTLSITVENIEAAFASELLIPLEVEGALVDGERGTAWERSLMSKIAALKRHVDEKCVPKLEYEKVLIRFEARTKQVAMLSSELDQAQREVHEVTKKLDNMKMHEMKLVTDTRLEQLDKDNELEMLSSQIAELSDSLNASLADLQHLSNLLDNEKGRNNELGNLLENMQRKEAASDALTERLRLRNTDLSQEVEDLQQKIYNYNQQLSHKAMAMNTETELMQRYQSLEETMIELRSEKRRMEAVLIETRQANDDFSDENERLHSKLRQLAESAMEEKKAFEAEKKVATGLLLLMSETIQDSCASLESRVDHELQTMESKIRYASEELRVRAIRRVANNDDFATKESLVKDSQIALHHALARHDEDVAEIEALRRKLHEVVSQNEALHMDHSTLKDDLKIISDKDEEIKLLKRALAQSEKRLAVSSEEQAQKFAQSARIIGYLESECFRLHGLCDYYKECNARLIGEVRVTLGDANFRDRAAAMMDSLKAQLKQSEDRAMVAEKNTLTIQVEFEKMIETIRSEQAHEMEVANTNIAELKAMILAKERDLISASTENGELNHRILKLEQMGNEGNQQLRSAITEAEKRRLFLERVISERETDINSLQAKLRESKIMIADFEERQRITYTDHSAQLTNELQNISDLTIEIEELKHKNSMLESTTQRNKVVLTEQEERLRSLEDDLAREIRKNSELMEKLSAATKEVSRLKSQLDATNIEKENSIREIEGFTRSISELEALVDGSNDRLAKSMEASDNLRDALRTKEESELSLAAELKRSQEKIVSLQDQIDELNEVNKSLLDEKETLMKSNEDMSTQIAKLEDQFDNAEAGRVEAIKELESKQSQLIEANERISTLDISLHDVTEKADQLEAEAEVYARKEIELQRSLQACSLVINEMWRVIGDDGIQTDIHYANDIENELNRLAMVLDGLVMEKSTMIQQQLLQIKSLESTIIHSADDSKMLQGIKSNLDNETRARRDAEQNAADSRQQLDKVSNCLFAVVRSLRSVSEGIYGADHHSLVVVSNWDTFSEDTLRSEVDAIRTYIQDMKSSHNINTTQLESRLQSVMHDNHGLHERNEELSTTVGSLEKRLILVTNEEREINDNLRSTVHTLEEELQLRHSTAEDLNGKISELEDFSWKQARECERLNEDLRESEDHRADLHGKVVLLEAEIAKASNDLEAMRKKLSSQELQLENLRSSSSRIKTEKEAMASIVTSMTADLERLRLAEGQVQTLRSSVEQMPLLQSELERILTAVQRGVGGVSVFASSGSDVNTSTTLSIQGSSLRAASAMTDSAIKSLEQFIRHHMDQQRTLQSLNDEIDFLRKQKVEFEKTIQILTLKVAEFESTPVSMRDYVMDENKLLQMNSLENDLRDARLQLSEAQDMAQAQQRTSTRLQNELRRLEEENTSLRRQLGAAKAALTSESNMREQEATNNLRTLEEYQSATHQIESLRRNYDMIKDSVQHLEKAVEQERNQKLQAETRLHEIQIEVNRFTTIQEEVKRYRVIIDKEKTANGALNESNVKLEEKLRAAQEETDLYRKKAIALEQRVQSIIEDKEELARRMQETIKLNRRAQITAPEPAPLPRTRDTRAVVLSSADDTSRDIRMAMDRQKIELDEAETKLLYERKRRQAGEKELEVLQRANAALTEECDRLKSYSSTLRTEGREAKLKILEISTVISDIVYQAGMDELREHREHAPPPSPPSKLLSHEHGERKLADVLGLPELYTLVIKCRDCTSGYRSELRVLRQRSLTGTSDQDLLALESRTNELSEAYALLKVQHGDDLKTMQTQRAELHSALSQIAMFRKRLNDLDHNLSQEKELKATALAEVDSLRHQVDKLRAQDSRMVPEREILKWKTELNTVKSQNAELRSRFEAAQEGLSVLKHVTESLETRLRNSPSSNVSVPLHDLYKQILLSIVSGDYLESSEGGILLLLYGPFIESLEERLTVTQRYYEQQVTDYATKLQEMMGKYRDAKHYAMELDKQMEDHLKAIFRSGRASVSEYLSKERASMKSELEGARQEVLEVTQEAANERNAARAEFNRVIADLNRAMRLRSEALSAVQQIERFCSSNGLQLDSLAVYKNLNKTAFIEIEGRGGSPDFAKKTIDTLMRGLMEADHELQNAERRSSSAAVDISRQQQRMSETFLTTRGGHRPAGAAGVVSYDLQTAERSSGTSAMRISKSRK